MNVDKFIKALDESANGSYIKETKFAKYKALKGRKDKLSRSDIHKLSLDILNKIKSKEQLEKFKTALNNYKIRLNKSSSIWTRILEKLGFVPKYHKLMDQVYDRANGLAFKKLTQSSLETKKKVLVKEFLEDNAPISFSSRQNLRFIYLDVFDKDPIEISKLDSFSYISGLYKMREQLIEYCKSVDNKSLQKIIELIKKVSFAIYLSSFRECYGVDKTATLLLQVLNKMETGEKNIIMTSSPPSHVSLIEIEKNENKTFRIKYYNTGVGSDITIKTLLTSGLISRCYSKEYENVTFDERALKKLFEFGNADQVVKGQDKEDVIGDFLTSIAGPPKNGESVNLQEKGSCAVQAVQEWVRLSLGADYKAFETWKISDSISQLQHLLAKESDLLIKPADKKQFFKAMSRLKAKQIRSR